MFVGKLNALGERHGCDPRQRMMLLLPLITNVGILEVVNMTFSTNLVIPPIMPNC